jgi:hypothetical protein
VSHDAEPADLTVRIEGEFDRVLEAEVQLIESYLGDLISAMFLTREEER